MNAYTSKDVLEFDQKWAEYNQCSYEMLHRLLGAIPSAVHNALDVGCGTGNTLLELKKAYPEASLFGMDPNKDMVQFAQKKVPTAHIIQKDLPSHQGVLDLVTSVSVLHHVATLDAWLESLHTIEAEYFLCIDWDKTYLPMRLRAPLLALRADVHQIFTFNEAKDLLSQDWNIIDSIQAECQSGWWQLWGIVGKRI